MNRETAIAHFKSFGAGCEKRHHSGRDVVGIQLRHSAATDRDLAFLEYLRDDVDVIGLEGTRVSDDGLKYLLRLRFLENVDLTNAAITDAGLKTLSQIPTLEYIHLEGTNVTLGGIQKLQNSLPTCEIVCDFDLDD